MCLGNILLVKGFYYSMSYIMYNDIFKMHKGERNIWITIITRIYYTYLSVVSSYVLGLNFGNVCNLY